MPEVSREPMPLCHRRGPAGADQTGLVPRDPAGLVDALVCDDGCDAGMHFSLLSLDSTWKSTSIRMR
jgi:hypothetical protein